MGLSHNRQVGLDGPVPHWGSPFLRMGGDKAQQVVLMDSCVLGDGSWKVVSSKPKSTHMKNVFPFYMCAFI